ncbi:hypothetical protein DKG77_07360 [Flagellimonas aquimarina]|uniref:Penicillin-binding protein activator LpoB n=1 Tax=Flagellimonas aquimarina TaxID=2201895 RepID=A0A316KV52_9FLAO|nr:hypothetical protein [Allomuricauda koreensis]PWL38102.1 hypothetical protein DKG77_07360 [Allomuricauda koreensis]
MIKETKIIALLILLTAPLLVSGQVEYIGLAPFKTTDINNYAEAEAITEKVKELFSERNRFTVLDRTKYSQTIIYKEIEVQKNIEYIEGYVIEQGKQNGAEAIVGGNLTSLTYGKDKNGLYECSMTFSITINDIENGHVIGSKNFNTPAFCLTCAGGTKTETLSSVLRILQKKIRSFIIETFPITVDIEDVYESKGGGEIIIIAGEKEGITAKDKFKVYEIIKSGNRTRKAEILEFNINRVEGDFSVGKIKGKKFDLLLEKFKNPNAKLECVTLSK